MRRRVHQQEFAVAWKAVATSNPYDEDDDEERGSVRSAWAETDTLDSYSTNSSPREV